MKSLKPIKARKLFIGVLSGTSMNSIDAVLVDFSGKKFNILEKINFPFNKKLATELLEILNTGICKISTLGTLDRQLGIAFAKAINKLLNKSKYKPEQIVAIGSHGQNIWHAPNSKYGFTMQIGDPNIISARTKILTIADFRRKDLALGGQGAPLAPALHAAIFISRIKTRAIINIGGISNITVLFKNKNLPIVGFDLGPGNCLMDEWVKLHFSKLNLNYDRDGKLAAKGKVIPELLEVCLKDRYFSKTYPKSTGREYFNQAWLLKKLDLAKFKVINNQDFLTKFSETKINLLPSTTATEFVTPEDVLATLLHLTAYMIKNQVNKLNKYFVNNSIQEIYICGGGAKNKYLLSLLKEIIDCPIKLTDELGLAGDWVEAVLFAWLAKQSVEGNIGNLSSVTGASADTILGGFYFP